MELPLKISLRPPAEAGSSLADFSILKMEAIRSYETSVDARSIQRHTPKDEIIQAAACFSSPSYTL
jgi:hypothetical protein